MIKLLSKIKQFKTQFITCTFNTDFEEKSKLNIGLIIIIFIQYSINMQRKVLNFNEVETIIRYMCSITLFGLYIWVLIGIARGQGDLIKIINLSLYIHVFYIAMTSLESYKFIYIFIYCIGHFITLRIQMKYFKNAFKCDYKIFKWILYIEVGIVIMGGMNHILFYTSNRLYNTSKMMSYELLK